MIAEETAMDPESKKTNYGKKINLKTRNTLKPFTVDNLSRLSASKGQPAKDSFPTETEESKPQEKPSVDMQRSCGHPKKALK